MLTVNHWPQLQDACMVIALSGWIDAGLAGGGTIDALTAQLNGVDEFATIDLTDAMDLQQTRPRARWAEDGNRVIDWPVLTFVAGDIGRDVVVVSGPEPSLRWRETSTAIVDVAQRLGVKRAYTVAGMPALVSHRRPVPVLATATHRSLAQEIAPIRSAYVGPTGVQTVVQRARGDAGVPCAGLWAQVPQYVGGWLSRPGGRWLLRGLAEVA